MSRKRGRALDPVKNEALLGRQPEHFSLFSVLVFFVWVFTNVFVLYCLDNHSEGIEAKIDENRHESEFFKKRKQKVFANAKPQVWRREDHPVQGQVKYSNFATRRVLFGDAEAKLGFLNYGFSGLATRNPESGDAKSAQTCFKPKISHFFKTQNLISLSAPRNPLTFLPSSKISSFNFFHNGKQGMFPNSISLV